MAIDPIDNARDDARRVDEKRQDQKRDQNKVRPDKTFAHQYQAALQGKQKNTGKDTDKTGKDSSGKSGEKSQPEGGFFTRVMEVFRNKDESKHQDDKKEDSKKEEKKDLKSEDGGEMRSKSVSEEGYSRVASKESHQGSGGESSGGGGEGGGSSSHQGSSSGQQGESSFSSDSQSSNQPKSKNENKTSAKGAAHFQGSLAPVRSSGSEGRSTGQQRFTEEQLDEIVQKVTVGINAEGQEEMEIHLADDVFSGLRFKATRHPQGVLLTFVCPDRDIRNLFIVHRPRIYARLKEKGIALWRIEVV